MTAKLKRVVTIPLEPEVFDAITRLAAEQKLSKAWLTARIIEGWLADKRLLETLASAESATIERAMA